MTVVVGYIPDQYGEAALAAGIEEAERRGTDLVVVNATKGDALVDRRYVGEAGLAELEERLAGVAVAHEVRQAMGTDVADEIAAGGRGDRRRRDRHRPAPPHPGRQADHGQRRPAGAPGGAVLGARRQAVLRSRQSSSSSFGTIATGNGRAAVQASSPLMWATSSYVPSCSSQAVSDGSTGPPPGSITQ